MPVNALNSVKFSDNLVKKKSAINQIINIFLLLILLNWILLNQKEPNEYVLSSNEAHSIREFVEEAFNFAGFAVEKCEWVGKGVDEKYVHEEKVLVQINPDFYRPAEVELLLGDSSEARRSLGWEPKTDFINLVRKMVDNDLKLSMV